MVDKIRRILLADGDHIGAGIPVDEYDGYIPDIYVLMQEQVGVEALASLLGKIEQEALFVNLNLERNLQVAKSLIALLPEGGSI